MNIHKVCTKCNILKPLDDFTRDKTKIDGRYSRCKTCKYGVDLLYRNNENVKQKKKITDHEYYIKNSDKIKDYSKKWYQENIDRQKELRKQYYLLNYTKLKDAQAIWNSNNKEKIKEYMKNYFKDRYNNDLNFKLRISLRSRFKACILDKEPFNYLNCSLDFFKKWIEFQFNQDSNLSWNNYGSYWHYDHVIPCASFDLTIEDNIHKCFHWSNFRPLNKVLNLQKSSKILIDTINNHKTIIEEFIKLYDVPR